MTDTTTTTSAVARCRAAVADLNRALYDLPNHGVDADITTITAQPIGAKAARLILEAKFRKVL